MERFKCSVCGFVFDPSQGDILSGIEPGISFVDLSYDYRCPVCGAGKEEFFIYD